MKDRSLISKSLFDLYTKLLDSLIITYPTVIIWFNEDGLLSPWLDINIDFFNEPLLLELANILNINSSILAAFFRHTQGGGFLGGYKVDYTLVPKDKVEFFIDHTDFLLGDHILKINEENVTKLHNFLLSFANIETIKILQYKGQVPNTNLYGIFGRGSLYDWKYYTYKSIWPYLDILYQTFFQLDYILGARRSADLLMNGGYIPFDKYKKWNVDMTSPLEENIGEMGSIELDGNKYGLNLFVHNTYLPYGLLFILGLDLLDKNGVAHKDNRLYVFNIVFEPSADSSKPKVIIHTIQQACRHIYYRYDSNNKIELYYNTSALAEESELAAKDDEYIKSFLHKAIMDSFIDSNGKKLLQNIIRDKIHKSIIDGTIDNKIANQGGYLTKSIEKEYNEYMRRSYDPTILITAIIGYVFSYDYEVYIIAPEENLWSLYHIDDREMGKKRTEKNYTYKGKLLKGFLQDDGRYKLTLEGLSMFLSDRYQGLGLYNIDSLVSAWDKLFTGTILDLDVIEKNHPKIYQEDLFNSIVTYRKSTTQLIDRFS